ncbi:MAG: RecX family transcriptional regulator [Phycisphaerales bacterium]|nr:RecX family transcriptional regulator [Phycisphaerales bacterium]
MAEIETIALTPNGPNRWTLKTPEHKRATLDDAAVIDCALVNGDPWTVAVQERVQRAIGEAGARLAAERLLRVRPRSSAELRERLGKRYPTDAVELAVDRLVRSGAVDDARLADQLAEQLGEIRPHAREAVRSRLERARVGSDVVERALDEHAPSMGESDRAVEAARAQARRLAALGIGPEAMRRRIYGALGRRGFDAETAAEAVEAVLGSWDEPGDGPDTDEAG